MTGGAAPPPPNGAPYAPSGLTATISNNNAVLTWTAGSGATSYNLYRAAESGYEGTNPVVTGITGTSYTNTSLNSGTTYYYQVVAVNGSGLSGFSAEAHATTSGVNPDPAQFNFETDPQGWAGGGGVISGVATSTAQHYAGNQSLAVNINSTASGSSSVSVGNVSVLPGMTITFHVWIPSGYKISNLQPYMQDNNWAWTSSWYGSFTPNAWNTLSLTVPANAVSPFHNLGIQFNTSAGWTNTCYIDSVSWNTPAPDFSLSANPTSLTVKGGTNGTSAITVTPMNGLNGCYTLSASNLPSGVTATFATNPITGGASTLMLTASNTVTSGTSNVTIIATCGLLSHTTTIALTLNAVTPPNTPPTLAPIANQTVNVGQTVAFTASATDTDQPPQTLTFALLAGATNATLNTNSGAFSFRPLVTQANSTNNFTLKVSDNGTPQHERHAKFFRGRQSAFSCRASATFHSRAGNSASASAARAGRITRLRLRPTSRNGATSSSPIRPRCRSTGRTPRPARRTVSTASNSARRCRKDGDVIKTNDYFSDSSRLLSYNEHRHSQSYIATLRRRLGG